MCAPQECSRENGKPGMVAYILNSVHRRRGRNIYVSLRTARATQWDPISKKKKKRNKRKKKGASQAWWLNYESQYSEVRKTVNLRTGPGRCLNRYRCCWPKSVEGELTTQSTKLTSLSQIAPKWFKGLFQHKADSPPQYLLSAINSKAVSAVPALPAGVVFDCITRYKTQLCVVFTVGLYFGNQFPMGCKNMSLFLHQETYWLA